MTILSRLEGSRFSVVNREWSGLPCVILGGGPSLTMFHVEQVRAVHATGRIRCIAINDAYIWAPWADVLYAADASWHNAHAVGTPKPLLRLSAEQVRQRFAAFPGLKCSIQSQLGEIKDDATHVLRNARTDANGRGLHGVGLSLDPASLITGSHSGWQAINFAALAGADPLILLGYDGRAADDGRSHWSGGHQGTVNGEPEYTAYRNAFRGGQDAVKASGITVWNCSPGSAIDTFEKMPLERALEYHMASTND